VSGDNFVVAEKKLEYAVKPGQHIEITMKFTAP
jgi:hypothetical protein